MACLRFGDAALGAVHEGGDGHAQLLLQVTLPEELLLQSPHPALVHWPAGGQVAQVCTLQRHLQHTGAVIAPLWDGGKALKSSLLAQVHVWG